MLLSLKDSLLLFARQDPYHLDLYYSRSIFLADINGEVPGRPRPARYAANLASLQRLVLFQFEEDDMGGWAGGRWFDGWVGGLMGGWLGGSRGMLKHSRAWWDWGGSRGTIAGHSARSSWAQHTFELGTAHVRARLCLPSVASRNSGAPSSRLHWHSLTSSRGDGIPPLLPAARAPPPAVVPKESSHFGFFNGTTLLRLQNTPLYQQDWIGLRSLDEAGHLALLHAPGRHMQFSLQWFVQNVVHPYLAVPAPSGAQAAPSVSAAQQ